MDLPTYTNIWRIEKRLYKLYDFRLPAPLPITWIGVFTAITVPYVVFLIAVGLPFNHNLVWLYVLPPGVLTWLCTRPVIESKRLPELVSSQLRYVAEPRTWCRMAPFAEKDDILVSAQVWHQQPPRAKPEKAKKSPAMAQASTPVLQGVAEESPQVEARPAKARRAVAKPLASARRMISPPVTSPSPEPAAPESPARLPVPERAPSHSPTKRTKAQPKAQPAARLSWSPWPQASEPDTAGAGSAAEPGPGTGQRPAWMIAPYPAETLPPVETPDPRALEVAHDSDSGARSLAEPHVEPSAPTAWPSPGPNLLPLIRPVPEPGPFPEAGPFPDVAPFPEYGPFPEASPGPEPEIIDGPDPEARTQARATASAAVDAEQAAPASSAKPRTRWMLRARPRTAAALAPAQPVPAPAQPAPVLGGLAPVLDELAPVLDEPAPVLDEPAPAEPSPAAPTPAELVTPDPPASELAALEAPEAPEAPEAATPEAAETEAAVPAIPAVREAADPEASEAEAPETAEDPETEALAPEALGAETAAAETLAPGAVASEALAPAPEAPASEPPALASAPPAPEPPAPEAPVPVAPAPVAARLVSVERERPVLSIERALSGPGSRGEVSWRRQVKVVAGGQGPGKRDQEAMDRERARLPLAGPRRIAVLGCTRGAGQTVTTLMTAHILAVVRGAPVAAVDLNPGATSLAVRRAPAFSVQALLAGQARDQPHQPDQPDQAGQAGQGARLDVIADLPENGTAHALEGDDYQRLADLLAGRYPLTMIDPAASGLTRVLAAADQLVLVAPASPDAATSLANTQQWLGAHGYGELASHAVTVVNGVSRRTIEEVLRAESVARGCCRAIVRVPWDDHLSARPGPAPHAPAPNGQVAAKHPLAALHPQTRLAYTALAGVLVAGMAAAAPESPVPGRNPGEHTDKESW